MLSLIFHLLLVAKTAEGNKICAASSALANEPDYHSYPPEIYDAHCLSNECPVGEITDYPTKPCFAVEKNDDHFKHTCGTGPLTVCPIRYEHIDEGLESQHAWIKSSPLCNLRDALPHADKPETHDNIVNIIVFGGSVTAGVSTQGCCDKGVCSDDKYYCINDYCNWVKFMGRWFSTFGPNVKTYNLAHAGYNSDTYKDKIVEKLNLIRPNFLFKKSDVVFLDLSVNDANTFEGTPSKMLVLERGLEALIRRIYWLSEAESMPTIVLLEQWMGSPHGSEYPADTPYTRAYDRIARHYNITLWSYRDMVREFYNLHTHDAEMNYLNFHNNYGPSSGHPPWHVHLFYADFVTAIIQNQLNKCNDSSVVKYPVIKSPKDLPEPLVPHKFHHCDPSTMPLISVTAPQVAQLRSAGLTERTTPQDLGTSKYDLMLTPVVPVYYSKPEDAWKLMEDKAGRPGFIHEFTAGSRSQATLTFHLNTTHAEFTNNPSSQLLQILFLRTYANAGVAKVLLCGKELHDGRYEPVVIDALWGDYKTFKFSLPEVYSIDLTKSNCNENERADKGSKYVTIQIVHFHDGNGPPEMVQARGNQKFKVVDIKVCKLARSGGGTERRP